jgi:hypothetical protein
MSIEDIETSTDIIFPPGDLDSDGLKKEVSSRHLPHTR